MKSETKLRLVKSLHTVVWALFAGAIFAIPLFAHRGHFSIAWSLIGLVFIEVLVLAANSMHCPLTTVAGRYTLDRHDNFDIYLPMWLARYNKQLFGTLYLAGVAYTVVAAARGA